MAQFNRSPQSGQPAPPPSFKTNVNRNKTKKWTEARPNNYDGDDWGGFDPYDEYGNYDEPSAPSGQAGHPGPPGPPAPGPMRPGMRQNSFERGEERRAFSSGAAPGQGPFPRGYPPPHPPYGQQSRGTSQGSRSPSDHGGRREFSQPSHVPPPLHMRPAQSPHDRGPPRPPLLQRPSDHSQQEQLPLTEHGADDGSAKPAPAIPFIRPSDIYKRMEQERERERQSLDSSRPSIDSSSSKRKGLENTDKGNGSVDPSANDQASGARSEATSSIPPRDRVGPPANTAVPTDAMAPSLKSKDPTQGSIAGFQSLVDQAFDRSEPEESSLASTKTVPGQRAVEDLSRSNTESTSGISPIMSRVPSAATAEARGRVGLTQPHHVPPIVEEASTSSPATQRQLGAVDESEGAYHKRKSSGPSPHASPARSPKVELNKSELVEPKVAEVDDESGITALPPVESSHRKVSDAIGIPPLHTSGSNDDDTSGDHARQGSGSHAKQTSRSSTPIASPVTGRQSPFPGRVKDLTGKYNDIHDESRRNSQASTTSKYSFSTWSRTNTGDSMLQPAARDAVAVESPTEDDTRPTLPSQQSFRPHLPGEWISTSNVTNAPGSAHLQSTERPDTARAPESALTHQQHSDEQVVDLAPSTSEHNSPDDKGVAQSALDAVKAAGNALGASLMSTTDKTHETRDFASNDAALPGPSATDVTSGRARNVGDVFLRPLEPNQAPSSLASSVAPTPPAKDTPKGLGESTDSYFQKPSSPRLSSDKSLEVDDNGSLESDRLHEEIVRSLTPQPDAHREEGATHQRNLSDVTAHRLSVPTSSQHSPLRNVRQSSEVPSQEPESQTRGATLGTSGGPGLLSQRFSFENRSLDLLGATGLGNDNDNTKPDLRVATTQDKAADIPPQASGDVRPVSGSSLVPDGAPRNSLPDVSPITMHPGRHSFDDRSLPSPIASEFPGHGQELLQQVADDQTTESRPVRTSGELPSLPIESSIPNNTAPAESGVRIPPFRQMMTIKSPSERIETYNSARKQFAEMDTGLRNWLGATLAARPEHNINTIIAPMPTTTPSGATGSPAHIRHTSNSFPSNSPQGSGNVEKVSAKGKDLLHSAGKLGGKGVVGAKGWLAKGKQKLRESSGGGDKAPPPPREPAPNATPVTTVPAPDTERSASPALTDEKPASARRPRRSLRDSSSWSSKRLSLTMDKLRNSIIDDHPNRTRSTLIAPEQSEGAVHPQKQSEDLRGSLQPDFSQHDDRHHNEPASEQHAATSSWRPDWAASFLDTPNKSRMDGADFRLGVLPSPGVETFTSSIRDADGNTVHGSPMKKRSSIAEFDRIWGGAGGESHGDPHKETPKKETPKTLASESDGHVDQSSWSRDELDSAEDKQQMHTLTEKQDTPMIPAPALFVNDREPGSPAQNSQTRDGERSFQSDSKVAAKDDHQHQSTQLTIRGHFRTVSEVTLGSEGVLEEPSAVEIVRVVSPRPVLITNRSSLPSQTMLGSQSNTPATTPHSETHGRNFNSHLDSPTLPAPTTPRHVSRIEPEDTSRTVTPLATPHDEKPLDDDHQGVPTIERMMYEPYGHDRTSSRAAVDHVQNDHPHIQSATNPRSSGSKVDEYGVTHADILNRRLAHSAQHSPNDSELTVVQAANDHGQSTSASQSSWPDGRHQIDERIAPSEGAGGLDEGQFAPVQSVEERQHAAGHVAGERSRTPQSNYSIFPISRQSSRTPDPNSSLDYGADARTAPPYHTSDMAHHRDTRQTSVTASLPPISHQSGVRDADSGARHHFRRASSGLAKMFQTEQMAAGNTAMTSTMDLDRTESSSRGKLVKRDRTGSLQRTGTNLSMRQDQEKEKRFSGLRSLFGRSKSNAMEPSKRNRLSKQAPMLRDTSQTSPKKEEDSAFSPSTPPVAESTLLDDNTLSRTMTPLSRHSSSNAYSTRRQGSVGTSSNGYRGGQGERQAQPTLPRIQPTRGLHSGQYAQSPHRFSFGEGHDQYRHGPDPNEYQAHPYRNEHDYDGQSYAGSGRGARRSPGYHPDARAYVPPEQHPHYHPSQQRQYHIPQDEPRRRPSNASPAPQQRHQDLSPYEEMRARQSQQQPQSVLDGNRSMQGRRPRPEHDRGSSFSGYENDYQRTERGSNYYSDQPSRPDQRYLPGHSSGHGHQYSSHESDYDYRPARGPDFTDDVPYRHSRPAYNPSAPGRWTPGMNQPTRAQQYEEPHRSFSPRPYDDSSEVTQQLYDRTWAEQRATGAAPPLPPKDGSTPHLVRAGPTSDAPRSLPQREPSDLYAPVRPQVDTSRVDVGAHDDISSPQVAGPHSPEQAYTHRPNAHSEDLLLAAERARMESARSGTGGGGGGAGGSSGAHSRSFSDPNAEALPALTPSSSHTHRHIPRSASQQKKGYPLQDMFPAADEQQAHRNATPRLGRTPSGTLGSALCFGGTGASAEDDDDDLVYATEASSPKMKGASYPGQEWTPAGLTPGR